MTISGKAGAFLLAAGALLGAQARAQDGENQESPEETGCSGHITLEYTLQGNRGTVSSPVAGLKCPVFFDGLVFRTDFLVQAGHGPENAGIGAVRAGGVNLTWSATLAGTS
ncbi:MAG: hypothetical protein M3O22_06730, partial [Pseudomonadota bacterium]|nr:hypothetical protein [Pseudomonadota bacterium]